MRNTLPLLSRPPASNSSFARAPSPLPSSNTPSHPVPTIRLVSATPSAAGSAGDASTSFASSSYASIAPFASSPLAPKSEAEAPRKRLVPKKSKLGLLGAGKKEKASKDFSDVVRRVGGESSTGRGGFEIYVDQGEDPDMDDIVVVKKKKSRLGLDGMKWGALGEVTNVPSAVREQPKVVPADNLLKVKGDENQKWWSIGRGRKDSKGKEKDQKPPARSKTPEPSKPLEGRTRFNSLDSGILLNSPAAQPQKQGTVSSVKTLLEVPVVTTTPADDLGETVPMTNGLLTTDGPPAGSIAVRAIRSMRSLARMASWAQLSNDKEGNPGLAPPETKTKTKVKEEKKVKEKDEKKSKEKGEMKKKKKKDKEKPKEKESKEVEREKEKTIRYSGSSFEAGALSAQPSPAPVKTYDGARTLTTRKKQSILGLGLPSTMRLSTVRDVSGSSTGSVSGIPQAPQRLSVDSAHLIMNAQGRPSSILSSGSSLRPPSTASGISTYSGGRSPRSSSSSVVSIRWDEAGLKSVKEKQRQERRTRREKDEKEGTKTKRESRKSSESRRRTPISEIFPEAQMQGQQRDSTASLSPPASIMEHPIVRVEEATADGHSPPTDDEQVPQLPRADTSLDQTPSKRARPRPMSEQMLGRPRPQPICDSSEGDAMLSLLEGATNDLASLINRLDLEATPGSTNNTPLRISPFQTAQDSPLKSRAILQGSPLKGELRESTASIASLRPYAKSQSSAMPPKLSIKPSITMSKAADLVGQQIAPWNELDWKVSPRKPLVRPKAAAHLAHKRTLTPSPADPVPVFQPLRPANVKSKAAILAEPASRSATPPVSTEIAAPSSRTFGSRPSKSGLKPSKADDEHQPSPTPVFSRVGHARKSSSLVPMNSKGSTDSLRRMGVPMTSEARKGLGFCGTLGQSTEPEVDPEDPDSDIPDELQDILARNSDDEMISRPLTPFDDTLSFRPLPAAGSPLHTALSCALPDEDDTEELMESPEVPVFQAQLFDEEANQAEIDDGDNMPLSPCEDDTRKSFDFTGELRMLNESGGSDRASFVEQLENAFKTPGRIELEFDFADDHLAPPVPALPKNLRPAPVEDVPKSFSNFEDTTSVYGESEETDNRDSGFSQVNEQDISFMIRELEDECRVYPGMNRASDSTIQSKPSEGRLNRAFKFGGVPSPEPSSSTDSDIRPLTLSDIIPPLTHSRSRSNGSMVEEDSSVLKSIMAQATEVLPEESESRSRVNSNASMDRRGATHVPGFVDETAGTHGHSRTESGISFTGFDSFDEVRRGFEYGPNRPAFYPPPSSVFRPAHGREVSVFSIASVSSYGAAMNAGLQDPFGYARDGPSRPPSMDDMSMSTSVDDTFSFIRRDRPRMRVDSDASSFYFQTSMHPYRRAHRRGPSAMSVASNAPPISLYNRSFAGHMRNDSNTSASSVAMSYAMHGAADGRAAWARHNRDFSVDSIFSENSERPMARPGLGDKMFDNAHGIPLDAIPASPESAYSEPEEMNRTSWDSIMDNDRYTSVVDDSLFDKTGKRTSVSSESVFGFEPSYMQYARPHRQQFRPLSIMSEMSVHSPVKEDDTMITMLGGGHVRRRSVSSLVDASPCVRMEKKHAALPGRILQFEASPVKESPKPRLAAQPSIASTSSYQFGDERMIKARQGLLERQSLEDSALMAQGEDLLSSLRERSIFSKPPPAGRSRSSTCTSASSGADTPPLSVSDGSSISGGSQSSIDLGHVNSLLVNTTHPSSGVARARARARARGTGHRRRIDQARMSRSSVYETIQEEASVYSSSPSTQHPTPQSVAKTQTGSPVINDSSIFVVDSDRDSVYSMEWDDERGITTLRRYYALRDEAQVTVDESKRVWIDTPFSVFALQSFDPPREPVAMQAMLEHSQKSYGPLPSELRPHRVRSRTSSRASPYPLRVMRSALSAEKVRSSPIQIFTDAPLKPSSTIAAADQTILREVLYANVNVPTPPPALGEIKPFSPFSIELDTSKQGKNAMGLPIRPRVTSSTRRAALGWSKRSTGKSSTHDCKENSVIIPTPSETLRINRPRPRGRPTPARVAVPMA